MKFSFDILNNFDEYHEIIPPEATHHDIEVLISKSFNKELLLCIIENVTVGNIRGIGTTHLRHVKQPDEELQKVIDEYWEIINKLQLEMAGIATYFDWYQRFESYVIRGENKHAKPPIIRGHNWANKVKKAEPGLNEYIKNKDQELTDDYIKRFLSRYVELLNEKSWFANLPFYEIIVKPISVFDEYTSKFIPLGNLYLHFGTTERKELSFYKDLVNKIILVWFRNYGARIVREIETQPNTGYTEGKESDKHIPRFRIVKHSEKLRKTKVNDFNNFKLIDLYEKLFDDPEKKEWVFDHLIHHDNEVFKDLVNILKLTQSNKNEINNIIHRIRDTATIYRECSLEKYSNIDDKCLEAFVKILSKRRIALVFILLLGFSPEMINPLITSGDRLRSTTIDSTIKYLWNNLFIPYPRDYNLTDRKSGVDSYSEIVVKKIFSTLSVFEEELIRKLYNRIISDYPEYENHRSNILKKVFSTYSPDIS
jgi:hypothetical protein